MEVTSLQYSIDASHQLHMRARRLCLIIATLDQLMDKLITLLGEGHEPEK